MRAAFELDKDSANNNGGTPASISHRTWLKSVGAFTGLGLTVGVNGVVMAADTAPTKKYGSAAMSGGTVNDPLIFFSIGIVTIVRKSVKVSVPACRWWWWPMNSTPIGTTSV